MTSMAFAAAVSDQEDGAEQDEHGHDMAMPGFRFHPTEEELVEFYLRRKVEGKRFNVEIISFLDLYRYDPWELPALAAIGEREWYFYVPRDKKYRQGNRPNRVTTSGYWKATGVDRVIRSEDSRTIGLKKTLVFYSGRAPRGLRSSWIMNEYRLPHHETEHLREVEISLCRVYKRAGAEERSYLHRSVVTKPSLSPAREAKSSGKQHTVMDQMLYAKTWEQTERKMSQRSPSSNTDTGTSLGTMNSSLSNSAENDEMLLHQSKQESACRQTDDDLHKLVTTSGQSSVTGQEKAKRPNNATNILSHFSTMQPPPPEIWGLVNTVSAEQWWD